MTALRRTIVGLAGVVVSLMACVQITGIDPGTPLECSTVDDCKAEETRCQTAVACTQGECVFDDLEQVPCDTGFPGDCAIGTQTCIKGEPVGECVSPKGVGCICKDNCFCGDGYLSMGEECDDGANVNGDKCSSQCKVENVLKVTADADHTCALLDSGNVKCWGANNDGQLGLGDTVKRGDGPNEMGDNLPAIYLGTGKIATAIAAGGSHTCALLDGGTVKCWGVNYYGQLGLGDTVKRGDGPDEMGDNLYTIDLGTGKTAKAIAAGGRHTCALLNDGNVKCWGANSVGLLGLGDTNNRGDAPGEMGNNLPAVDLGTGKTAKAIAVGTKHTCALLNDGNVKCWGANTSGELGLSDTSSRGYGPNQMGDNLPAIDLGTGKTATAIAAGTNHTCALLNDGNVKCWGRNDGGQLGLGDTAFRGDGPNEMGDNLPAIDLGTGKTATAIAAGFGYTCALLNDGNVKCWGFNNGGQLGLGDTSHRGDGPNEMGDNLPAIDLGTGKTATAIAAGNAHTCALLNDGSVKCWGLNNSGQLGQGNTSPRGAGPNEMGDNLPTVKLYSDTW